MKEKPRRTATRTQMSNISRRTLLLASLLGGSAAPSECLTQKNPSFRLRTPEEKGLPDRGVTGCRPAHNLRLQVRS
jgi:hypothetical protein